MLDVEDLVFLALQSGAEILLAPTVAKEPVNPLTLDIFFIPCLISINFITLERA